jgi:hypothetical protein
MKRNLEEQLNRISTLLYGKKVISEQTTPIDTTQKVDDPKKADYVGPDVNQFYNTLDTIDEPLYQQPYGSMEYQKDVESVQIGLELLDYDLPTHGVDGLYGPETANSVEKFKADNNIQDLQEPLDEVETTETSTTLISPITYSKITSHFGVKRTNERHPGVDLSAPSGTEIKSPANGVVLIADFMNNKCGGKIQIDHQNGFTTKFCHCSKINVKKGQNINQGDVIGLSGGKPGEVGAGNSTGPHLHFELYKDGQLVNPLSYIEKSGLNLSTTPTKNVKSIITPKMVDVMTDKLKAKNITSNDIKKYVDAPITTGGSNLFTDLDLRTSAGYSIYKEICQKYIDKQDKNLLNINGNMLADGAKEAIVNYNKYIPPELALAQLKLEGGFSDNPKARPIRTKNPFNVGNVDSGQNVMHDTVQNGINSYYSLIARSYLTKGKTAADLLNDFKNKNGLDYATSSTYESTLKKIVPQINKISQQVLANHKTTGSSVS